MQSLSQISRKLQIDTPLGQDAFILNGLEGEEQINGLFQFHLYLQSDHLNIAPEELVGHLATITIKSETGDAPDRSINGFINRLTHGLARGDGLREYQAELVPALWLSTESSHYRLWEHKHLLDIIRDVLKPLNILMKLDTSKIKIENLIERELCIQFGESDFEFITRLLQEEGINYYFQHEANKHSLILADSLQGYMDCKESKVHYDQEGSFPGKNTISQWQHEYQFHAGSVTTTDYNEQAPTSNQAQSATTLSRFPNIKSFEQTQHFAYLFENGQDGKHQINASHKQRIAQQQMERIETNHSQVSGTSTCHTFTAGGKFELSDHSSQEDKKYLITRIIHRTSDGNSTPSEYHNQFFASPSDKPIRPQLTLQKPILNGLQTAEVIDVKGAGEGADKFVQVKVKFFWSSDQKSCWIRTGQLYAGKNWGSYFVPRVGQEVIINFINGNPDRPIITGAVYNQKNQAPPYTKTQSGIKTESQDFNELRFDDKAGSEEVYIQAGKDLNVDIKNNETKSIVNDQTLNVDNDQKVEIGNDQSITIENNRTIEVRKGNESMTVAKGHHSLKVDKGNHTLTVSKGDHTTKVDKGDHQLNVMGDSTLDSQKTITLKAAKSVEIKVGGSTLKVSTTGIELKIGTNSIKLDPSGASMNGTMVKVNGSAMTEVKGGGMLKMQGALTMIN